MTEQQFHVRQIENGDYVAEVPRAKDDVFATDPAPTIESARKLAADWLHWFNHVSRGEVESIYYILLVPETWSGPPPGSHPLSGLHMKIGRTNNVLTRLQNLKTGSSGDLIIHALEPGGAELERERHRQFAEDRRHGEWFSCSPALSRHAMNVWSRHRVLPREHQHKMLALGDRISIYRAVRATLGSAPDMVNPSINEPWYGKVLVDLVYPESMRGRMNVKRDGIA